MLTDCNSFFPAGNVAVLWLCPASEKARAGVQLPLRPGPDPGSRIPSSTHGTFSLSPCPLLTAYPGRTLGSSATGWYCCLPPACCRRCLSSSLASGFPLHPPQQSHGSAVPAPHGTQQHSAAPALPALQPSLPLPGFQTFFPRGFSLRRVRGPLVMAQGLFVVGPQVRLPPTGAEQSPHCGGDLFSPFYVQKLPQMPPLDPPRLQFKPMTQQQLSY